MRPFPAHCLHRHADAGAIDVGVDPAEGFDRRVETGLDRRLIGDVDLAENGAVAEVRSDLLALCSVHVENGDPGATFGEIAYGCLAKARGATGDNRNRFTDLHAFTPLLPGASGPKLRLTVMAPGVNKKGGPAGHPLRIAVSLSYMPDTVFQEPPSILETKIASAARWSPGPIFTWLPAMWSS